ncbi:FecR family protein [Variovorax sp.]|uniref:FecR family protein n=1 Tax=Variovorax sp. TaxID=1871043 RepID=UPI002D68B07B|nr:FecR domain-containing protein [Variovorax sp.]HYP82787.1 FecR domain-containing protein [Variovorax sp.]
MNSPTQAHDAADHDAGADARALEMFAQDHDPIELAAATWAARRHNGLSAEAQIEWQAWLSADPRHAVAYEGITATMGRVRLMPAEDVTALKSGLTGAPRKRIATPLAPPFRKTASQPAERGKWRRGRGPLFAPAAVAVLVVAVVGTSWLGLDRWRSLPIYEHAFATERGQQIVATLPDDPTHGSTVQLDTATRLDVRLFHSRREVHLTEGQALFSVSSDKARPFHVRAGNLLVTVVGTRFSVRHTHSGLDAGRTVVSVEEGSVRVSRAAPPAQGRDGGVESSEAIDKPVDLAAGQMVVGDDSGIGPVTPVSPAASASWRSGRISFDSTPLALALAEFERYRSTGLVINDPAVAKLKVGGSYNVQQLSRFTDALPHVLPVRLVPHGDVTEIALRKP